MWYDSCYSPNRFSVDLVLLLFLHHVPFAVSPHMNFSCYFHFQFFFSFMFNSWKDQLSLFFEETCGSVNKQMTRKTLFTLRTDVFRWRFLSKTENQCHYSTCIIRHTFFFRLNAPTKLLTLYMSKYLFYNGYIFIWYCIIMYV